MNGPEGKILQSSNKIVCPKTDLPRIIDTNNFCNGSELRYDARCLSPSIELMGQNNGDLYSQMTEPISNNGTAVKPGSFYAHIVKPYNFTFKVNGYQRSLRRYLRRHPLPLPRNPRILDAGCGTGLLTITLLKYLEPGAQITAVDLSGSSLETARRAVAGTKITTSKVSFVRANVLELPFDDDSFDFIVSSGALEYVPLEKGFEELARVLVQRGYLLHLPVKPALLSSLLERIFRFKAHPPLEVRENTDRYFRVVRHDEFPPLDPISWSRTAVIAQKE